MQDINEERRKIVAIQAQNELDSQKLLELVREINAQFDAERRYVIMTEKCPYCNTKHRVHVSAGVGTVQVSEQTILCLNCNKPFNKVLPGEILRGPFPV